MLVQRDESEAAIDELMLILRKTVRKKYGTALQEGMDAETRALAQRAELTGSRS